mgnify:FL=1
MNELNEKLALDLFDIGAVKFGAFKLKLHETNPEAPLSPIYIDLRITRSFPELFADIVYAYDEILRKIAFDRIADVPTAATPFVGALVYRSEYSMISPKISKTHGLSGDIDGFFEQGDVVVVVDNLITTANSKLEAIDILKRNGLIVEDVVVLVDRQQGGKETLEKAGYQLHSVFTITDMLGLYLENDKIGQEKYEEVMFYLGLGANL